MNYNSLKYKSKFLPPYDENKKPVFSHKVFSRMAGVYVIKENNIPVYVGYSVTNLYRTLYRHFETWNHRGQEIVTYVNRLKRYNYSVRILVTNYSQAARWESYLIGKLKPRDNAVISPIILTKEEKEFYQDLLKNQNEEPAF